VSVPYYPLRGAAELTTIFSSPRVAPAELEGFLLDHPDVADAGVVGMPDESAGELPLAFVALGKTAQDRVAQASEKQAELNKIRASVVQFVKDHKIKYKHLCDVQV